MTQECQCIVEGCPETGRNRLGVRLRVAHSGATPFPNKGRTDAIFSVDGDALLCDRHALGGVAMTLVVEPRVSQKASLAVISGNAVSEVRTIEIKQPLSEAA
jgi:hypothetical protein